MVTTVQKTLGAWYGSGVALAEHFSSTPTPGNALLALVWSEDAVASVDSAGWSLIEPVLQPNANIRLYAYGKVAGASEPTLVHVGTGVGGRRARMALYELAGTLDVHDKATDASPATITGPSLTPSAAGTIIAAFIASNQTYVGWGNLNPVAPMTTEYATSKSGGRAHSYVGRIDTTSGAYVPSATNSGAAFNVPAGVIAVAYVGAPVAPPPDAAFSASPRIGSAPLEVQVVDESSGSPTSWLWDFGDGTTSTLQAPPPHVYGLGVYDLTLTVTNANGSTSVTHTAYVQVYEAFALDVFRLVPPGDAIEYVATLDGAFGRSIRPVRNAPGSGQFSINRYDPNATAEVLAQGNLVKVRIPEISDDYLFAWFMEHGDFQLVDPAAEGGETITIGGDGALKYWDWARWLSAKFVVPWWPADADDPPAGAKGMVRVKAGRYRFYDVVGGVIDDYDEVTVGAFDAYFDSRRTYLWPAENSQRFLVDIMPGQPHDTRWFHPHQDGVTEYLASYAVGDAVVLSDIGDGDKPGQVLERMWQEGQAADRPVHPIPLMTIGFDDTVDSDGNAWASTVALAGVSATLGESYLETVERLVATGALDVEMSPNLVQEAWNSKGRDLAGGAFGAGVVRFEKGANIVDALKREREENPVATFIEVAGTEGSIGQAELPDASSRVAREASATGDSNDEAVLEAMGLADLEGRLVRSDAVGFKHVTGDDEAAGRYLPGPEGSTHGHYWLGDVVRLHTGTGEMDFNEEDMRVAAITIEAGAAGALNVTVEVGSVLGEAERALYDISGPPASASFAPRSQFTETEVAESAHPGLESHDELGLATQAELDAEASTRASDDATIAGAISGHLADTTAAHAASAIGFTPNGSIAATDVQAAIQEVRDEALSNPMTTAADLIVGGTSGVPARLGKGSDGQVLTVDPTTHLLVWATPSSGFADPMTTRGDLIYRGGSGTTRRAVGADGYALVSDGTDPVYEAQYGMLGAWLEGPGGGVITTGVKGDIRIPCDCYIERASLLADQSGSIVIDLWVDTYANYPPTVADTITASAKPTLSSASKASDTTLTGWSRTLTEGSTLRVNVDSVATVTRVYLELRVRRL